MDHAEISEQIHEIINWVSGDKVLQHQGKEVPFAPAEISVSEPFADAGGGIFEDYEWSAVCHRADFSQQPEVGEIIHADGKPYAIQRIGKIQATGEIILYFANPDN